MIDKKIFEKIDKFTTFCFISFLLFVLLLIISSNMPVLYENTELSGVVGFILGVWYFIILFLSYAVLIKNYVKEASLPSKLAGYIMLTFFVISFITSEGGIGFDNFKLNFYYYCGIVAFVLLFNIIVFGVRKLLSKKINPLPIYYLSTLLSVLLLAIPAFVQCYKEWGWERWWLLNYPIFITPLFIGVTFGITRLIHGRHVVINKESRTRLARWVIALWLLSSIAFCVFMPYIADHLHPVGTQ